MSLREAPLAVLWWVPVLASVIIMWGQPCRGDDTSCLRGFKASIQDPGGRLSGWTASAMASPCTALDGVSCSSNRVVSIVLNVSGLAGTISPSLADCTNLQTLDLSSNRLSGPLPPNIGNLSYLTALNLSNNQLDGDIPLALSACAYLNYLDLHANRLSGPIPAQLGILPRLSFFDVSHNRLSGMIPSTLSNTSSGAPRFNASSFDGNKGLYGYPLPPATNHKLTVLAIVGIGLGSGLLSLIVSFAAVCVWLRVSEQGYAAQEGKISQLMSES